jgi:hypothetical protein
MGQSLQQTSIPLKIKGLAHDPAAWRALLFSWASLGKLAATECRQHQSGHLCMAFGGRMVAYTRTQDGLALIQRSDALAAQGP